MKIADYHSQQKQNVLAMDSLICPNSPEMVIYATYNQKFNSACTTNPILNERHRYRQKSHYLFINDEGIGI